MLQDAEQRSNLNRPIFSPHRPMKIEKRKRKEQKQITNWLVDRFREISVPEVDGRKSKCDQRSLSRIAVITTFNAPRF